ncbi:MAG: hypothetical protein OHK0022_58330 [Roseiflexaceae bacterium]
MELDELWGEIDKKSVIFILVILVVAGILHFTLPPLFEDETIQEFVRSLSTDVISTCLIFALPYLAIDARNKRKAKKREEALLSEIETRVAALIKDNQKSLISDVEQVVLTSMEKYRGLSGDTAVNIKSDGGR